MDGDATHRVAFEVHLAGMDPSPDLDAKVAH
jgi:hypothetical protein